MLKGILFVLVLTVLLFLGYNFFRNSSAEQNKVIFKTAFVIFVCASISVLCAFLISL